MLYLSEDSPMLQYSPMYNEFVILSSKEDRIELAKDFYSDKLDTLNYIIYGEHIKTMRTFKLGVIHALKVECCDEYSCDYITSLKYAYNFGSLN